MTEAEFWTLILTSPPHDVPDDFSHTVDKDVTAFTIAPDAHPSNESFSNVAWSKK